MKTFTLTFMLCLLANTCLLEAATFRVNNNLPSDWAQGIFRTILEANNDTNVAPGDTLIIEGSVNSYGNVTITKRLVLIGTGYFLPDNPQTSANLLTSRIGAMILEESAAGSVLIGLVFSGSNLNHPTIRANDVIIMRCYLDYSIYVPPGSIQNIKVIQNYFNRAAITHSNLATFSDIEFKNNIVNGAFSFNDVSNRIFSAVENNVFRGNISVTAFAFRSNIIATTSTNVTIRSANIQNNLVLGSQLSGNGNITYDATQLFVPEDGNSTDARFRLQDNSPYKTSGYNNAEPGVFGGNQPYVLSGMPPIPSIYDFHADGFGSPQSGLPIRLKVKSNQ